MREQNEELVGGGFVCRLVLAAFVSVCFGGEVVAVFGV
jgi:hypothetical protein